MPTAIGEGKSKYERFSDQEQMRFTRGGRIHEGASLLWEEKKQQALRLKTDCENEEKKL